MAQEPIPNGGWTQEGSPFSDESLVDPEASFFRTQKGGTAYQLSALARASYINDQRLQWSGQEGTFGVEGVFAAAMLRQVNGWEVGLETELFLNQPYDRNILVDTAERVSFRGNFEIDPVEINQMYLEACRGDWSISFGKRWTPFGRFYFPTHTNALVDAPFIRTEAINFRETGLQVDFSPGLLDLTVAVVNGSEDQDTNSSKAGIVRMGINGDGYAFGGSVKWQDGIGSESQKYRNNLIGLDGMIRQGRWTLSGEVIYDEYGFRRAFDPLDITWGRSIYNRHLFGPEGLRGIGYYINLNYCGDVWSTVWNYGVYSPKVFTGDLIHDRSTHRGYAKFIRHFGQGLDGITTILVENDVPNAQANRTRKGVMMYFGMEYRF